MGAANVLLLMVVLVVVATAKDIITVRKCCAKGEYLSENGSSCIRFSKRSIETVKEELLNPCANPEQAYWLPKPLSTQEIFVKYSRAYFKKSKFVINAEDKSMWNFSESGGKSLSFRIVLPFSQMTELSTSAFCFDAMAKGSNHIFVINAVLPEIRKCCRKGEQLNEKAEFCEARPGSKVEETENEIVAASLNHNDTYWLPNQLRRNSFVVHYRDTFPLDDRIILEAEDSVTWKIDTSRNVVVLNKTFAEGISKIDFTQVFCFDAISKGCLPRKALLATFQPNYDTHTIRKCCPAAHVLSSKKRCIQHTDADWNLLNSKAVPVESDIYGEEIISVFDAIHPQSSCRIMSSSNEKIFRQKMYNVLNSKYLPGTTYCADYQRVDNDNTREVLAQCTTLGFPFYERVRLFSIVPPVMLAAGLFVLLHREETHTTMHGIALVCHVGTLLVANTMQAVWFYKRYTPDDFECDTNYAYTIYFFLLSGGLWLNVVSTNMAVGFRQPPRARTRSGSGYGGRSSNWRDVLSSCAYSWGVAGAITFFAIGVYRRARGQIGTSLTPPSFFETKTCFPEAPFHRSPEGELYQENRMGTIYYFYIPMCIMAFVNAFCLVLTTLRIRFLSRESSRVKSRTSVGYADRCVPRGIQDAVLYVKLLLSAGVLELLVEGGVWAAWALGGSRGDDAGFFSDDMAYTLAAVGTFVDMARAAVVWWLCCGRWCGLDFIVCMIIECLRRRQEQRPQQRPPQPQERRQEPRAGPDVISNVRPLPAAPANAVPSAPPDAVMTHL